MAMESAFTVVRVSHTYEVLDRRWMAIRTRHSFEIEALRPHRLFLREYTWDNALGIEKPPQVLSGLTEAGSASHRLQGPVINGPKGKRVAVIDLGHVLQPGETDTIEVEHFFVRINPDLEAYVGEASKPGCKRIELHAILPSSDALRPHEKYRPLDGSNWVHWESLTPSGRDDGRVDIEYIIDDPTPGMRYRIGWDQPNLSAEL